MRALRPCRLLCLALILTFAGSAWALIPMETTPSYESSPQGQVATGGGWADVDGDGWLDMVIANGNDINRQRVAIYHNNGDGTFPATPTWTSNDVDYHGHLDLGDIDGDGLVDVAVGVYLGPSGFSQPGQAKVYLNNGVGGFSANPDWESGIDFYCFSVALGDVDGDGDLDLACAAGESYNHYPETYKIFINNGGALEPTPSWQAATTGFALDVTWADIDLDGDLDLGFSGESAESRIYINEQTDGGGLPTTPGWTCTDLPSYSNTVSFADWNNDCYPEFASADNYQLGGDGYFKVYANNAGSMETTPSWRSNTEGYGSHVSWVDLDLDGDQDLAAGRWWGNVRIYENNGGGVLTGAPVWTSSSSSVIENFFWGDVDNDGLRSDGFANATGDGARTFFKLGHAPVRSVDVVRIDGTIQPPSAYVVHTTNGWISTAGPPAAGHEIEIEYSYSQDLDLGVSNWDSSKGNYVFLNTSVLSGLPDFATAVLDFKLLPNPVVASTVFRYRGEGSSTASLAIYDVRGRQVRRLHDGALDGGLWTWEWDARGANGRRLVGGVYFAKIQVGGQARTLKVVVM